MISIAENLPKKIIIFSGLRKLIASLTACGCHSLEFGSSVFTGSPSRDEIWVKWLPEIYSRDIGR